MLLDLTKKMLAAENLTFHEAHAALNHILTGNAEAVPVAGFLTALAAKGETADEVAGMARAMRDHAVPVRPQAEFLVDTCGTGGDGANTFNISTIAAFVVAGAGVAVAKHGNRAITSQCGSADLFEALGVNINAAPEVVTRCIEQAGIGFMFAPNHHPAMKFVQPVRKALGFRTVFNVLGPLSSPAEVPTQIIGVPQPELMPIMIHALKALKVRRAIVVYGDGLDEFTTAGPSDIMELRNGVISQHVIDYSDYNIARAGREELSGGALADNVRYARGILDGSIKGARRDIVLLNAAVALMVAGKVTGIADGLDLARQALDSGAAAQALHRQVEISQQG